MPLAQVSALPAAEHDGAESAVGLPAEVVPTIMFADWLARIESGIVPAPVTVPVNAGDGMERLDGNVVLTDGTPLPLVISTPLLAVAKLPSTPALL